MSEAYQKAAGRKLNLDQAELGARVREPALAHRVRNHPIQICMNRECTVRGERALDDASGGQTFMKHLDEPGRTAQQMPSKPARWGHRKRARQNRLTPLCTDTGQSRFRRNCRLVKQKECRSAVTDALDIEFGKFHESYDSSTCC